MVPKQTDPPGGRFNALLYFDAESHAWYTRFWVNNGDSVNHYGLSTHPATRPNPKGRLQKAKTSWHSLVGLQSQSQAVAEQKCHQCLL